MFALQDHTNSRVRSAVSARPMVMDCPLALAIASTWALAGMAGAQVPDGLRAGPVDCELQWSDAFGGPPIAGLVNAIVEFNEELYVGGTFNFAGGVSANRIARWNGTTWSPLGSGMNDWVYALTVYNGELIAGGSFTSAGGASANRIARWNGTAWAPLGSGMNDWVYALTVYNGELIAGGSFTSAGGVSANRIASWNGTTWTPLGSGMSDSVQALTVYNGELIAGGSFTSAGGASAIGIACWNGTTWAQLGGGMNGNVEALTVYNDALIAGGRFTSAGGVSANFVARWNGTTWAPLGSGVGYYVYALTVYNGELIAGGAFTSAGGVSANRIARWNGTTWSPLGSGVDYSVSALTVYNGELIAGGNFTSAGGVNTGAVARWRTGAWHSLGPTLGNGLNGVGRAILVVEPGGGVAPGVYVGGDFTFVGDSSARRIAKWDGTNWSPLGTGMDREVWALTVYNGELRAGGYFTSAGGVSANRIARWNGTTWAPLGSGASASVYALTVYSGELIAGGSFSSAGGVSANRIARWNGTSWAPLGTGMEGRYYPRVDALTVYNSELIAGGSFTIAGGVSANLIARWNGTTWSPLGSGVNGNVFALTVHNAELIAGGYISSAGGASADHVARWNGTTWAPLGSGISENWVVGLAGFRDDPSGFPSLYAVGSFDGAGGVASANIAKWSYACATTHALGDEILPPGNCQGGELSGEPCFFTDGCPGGSCAVRPEYADADAHQTWLAMRKAHCSSGPDAGKECVADDHCRGGTCTADPAGSIQPWTSVFYYDKVYCAQEVAPDACTQWEDRLIVGERPASGSIQVQWHNHDGDPIGQPVRYSVKDAAAENRWVVPVRYFLNPEFADADVWLRSTYSAVPQYNSAVRAFPRDANGNTLPAHVKIDANGLTVNLTCPALPEPCPPRKAVIRYTGGAGELIGLEVAEFLRLDSVPQRHVDVGRRIPLPEDADACRAVMIANAANPSGVKVAWQRGENDKQTADVFPIRPNPTNSNNLQVAWYQSSMVGGNSVCSAAGVCLGGDRAGSRCTAEEDCLGLDLGNCWPWAIRRYTTNWPADPQTHVVEALCAGGTNTGKPCGSSSDCPGGTCNPVEGSAVDLGHPDPYCGHELMYQFGFAESDPSPNVQPLDIRDYYVFKARRPGYSVIRFDRKPNDLAACGDDVAFEVIASYGPRDNQHQLWDTSMVYNGEVSWHVGSWIWGLAEAAWHNTGHPLYRFGWVRDGLPYAPFIYHPVCPPGDQGDECPVGQPSPDYTGQIIPVNSSLHERCDCTGGKCIGSNDAGRSCSTVADCNCKAGGILEAWWYQAGRASTVVCDGDHPCTVGPCIDGQCRDVAGNHAEGLFWPHKVKRYNATWPAPDPNREIIVASRRGTGPTGRDPLTSSYDTSIWSVYSRGNRDGAGFLTLPGWNPNDEHAEIILVNESRNLERLFATRDDNPWRDNPATQPITGHPWVLTQRRVNLPEGDGLWQFNLHHVVTETPTFPLDFTRQIDWSILGEVPIVAGQQLIPPLFPVNRNNEPCLDAFGDPSIEVVGDGAWVDRKGNVWAVEQWHDGYGEAGSEGDPSIPVIYPWEVWIEDGDVGCQPWRANVCEGGTKDGLVCAAAADCPGGLCDLSSPYPITFQFNWPVYQGQAVCYGDTDEGAPCDSSPDCLTQCSCSYANGDPDCARDLELGAVVELANCGPLTFLHDSVGVRVIDPQREVCVSLASSVGQVVQSRFAQLPPHLYAGRRGGDPTAPAFADRIRYDSLQSTLCVLGILTERDLRRFQDVRISGVVNCATSPAPYCAALRALYNDSQQTHRAEPFHTICVGGSNASQSCTEEANCPNGQCLQATLSGQQERQRLKHVTFTGGAATCVGGSNAGRTCLAPAQCPGGECVLGPNDGWVTLATANASFCLNDEPDPDVQVWHAGCNITKGEILVREPLCPFTNSVSLLHSRLDAPAGGTKVVHAGGRDGKEDQLYYHWQYTLRNPDPAVTPDFDPAADWLDCNLSQCAGDGRGLSEIVLEGTSILTLQDTWWRVRYRGINSSSCSCSGAGCNPDPSHDWPYPNSDRNNLGPITAWSGEKLAEGWVKRVVRGLNPFNQRISNFRDNEIATYVDMIEQAGPRFEEEVPLSCNPSALNDIKLIQAYATVLKRAREIVNSAGQSTNGTNLAIMLVASRLTDLYVLLGHEAFADATDPTVGVCDDEPTCPTFDPGTIFPFLGFVNDLIEEELILLRGRDECSDITVPAADSYATVYNRFSFNVGDTGTEGAPAYAVNYDVETQIDASTKFPQGHGDAWGHYLTAIKQLYDLLRDPRLTWVNSSEEVTVDGVAQKISYGHERRFARAAAAKARTGAAVTSLEFRKRYRSDATQQNGYPDDDKARRWGVDEWARRAGQGAYFDWIVSNALLPCDGINDPDCPVVPPAAWENGDIQKIDRATVSEIREIAAAYDEIQSTMDAADLGLNPLGLAPNVVPFGLEANGRPHFEQIFERAVAAVSNAFTLFNWANDNTRRLEQIEQTQQQYDDAVAQRELEFTGQLIQIFGRPYPEDPTYLLGYYGPDLTNFEAVELPNLFGAFGSATSTTTFRVDFNQPVVLFTGNGGVEIRTTSVEYTVSTDGLGIVKNPAWSQRPEPGEIQLARSEIIQALIRYVQAADRYEAHLETIAAQRDLLASQYALNNLVLNIQLQGQLRQQQLNAYILDAQSQQLAYRRFASDALTLADAFSEGLPGNMIFGFANGGDLTAPFRQAIKLAGQVAARMLNQQADNASLTGLRLQQDKELAASQTNIAVQRANFNAQIEQQIVQLEQLVRNTASIRLDVYMVSEAMNQAVGRYLQALGRGDRLLDERELFRQQNARRITELRYRDMAHRLFRNDALGKYRQQFDLAARYVFLAARALDYETNYDPRFDRGEELAEIQARAVYERSLGQLTGGNPVPGTKGLAGLLGDMRDEWLAFLADTGGAQQQTKVFSLRYGLFRVPAAANASFRDTLRQYIEPDLQQLPEYQQFCTRYCTNSGNVGEPCPPTQALVIPFGTTIASGDGLNFFGFQKTLQDPVFTSDRLWKVQRVGVLFSGFSPAAQAFPAYLVPTGADIMRTSDTASTREWHILDQTLRPVSRVSPSQLGFVEGESNWLPWDNVDGGASGFVLRRRIPQIEASPGTQASDAILSPVLTGRSVWNTNWVLIIPAVFLDGGLESFLADVTDIRLVFDAKGYATGAIVSSAGSLEDRKSEVGESEP